MSRRSFATGLSALVVAGVLLAGPAAFAIDADTSAEPTPTPTPTPSTNLDVPLGPFGTPFLDVGGPPQPVFVGTGTDTLIRGPDLQGANDPTLYERFGGQGYVAEHRVSPAVGGGAEAGTVAGAIFATAVWLAQAVMMTVQWAFSLDLFSFLSEAVAPLVAAIRRVVYTPFVTTAVVLAALWMVWHGLVRRRGTLAFEGMAWTVAALALGAAFLAAPGAVLDGPGQLGTRVSRAALSGVSVVDAQTGPRDGTTTTPTFDGNRGDAQLRLGADRFWRVFVHQPWTVMQFGDARAGRRFGEPLLEATTISREESQKVDGDEEALAALVEGKQADYTSLQEQILAQPRSADWFRGGRSVERIGLASLTLAGIVVGGVILLVVAAAVVLTQIALLLAVLVAPVALLLGIHPGTGRVIALRWAQLLVGLLVKRVVLGVVLAVLLVANGILLDATYPLGWFVTMGLQSLMVAAVVVYRRPLLRLVGPTTVPVFRRSPPAAEPHPVAAGMPPPPVQQPLGRTGLRRRQAEGLRRVLPPPHASREPRPSTSAASLDSANDPWPLANVRRDPRRVMPAAPGDATADAAPDGDRA